MKRTTPTLHLQDCMQGMAEMDDNTFDVAIVDPPYGIAATWSKSRGDRFYKQGKLHTYQNTDAPGPEYFKELFRVSKNQIIWGGNYFTDNLPPGNHWIVWDKVRDFHKGLMSEAELAWHSFSQPVRICKSEWNGALKGQETSKCEKIHPHQKPIHLYKWCLLNYCEEGQTILDTHTGSGSLALACYDLGFEFTGFELDEKYFQATVKRIKKHVSQTQLDFAYPKPERLEQLTIE